MSSTKLFTPIRIGSQTLKHRVVLAPMTRLRNTKKEHVPVADLVAKYYAQRSSLPGSLLITEGTLIAPKAGGMDNLPGIWSEAQIAAWKQVTDGVHANGSYIFLQIAALGRAGDPTVLLDEGYPFTAPSPIGLDPKSDTPRELTETEIQEFVELFAQAGKNAVEAGFDGVEVHGANGFLVDQFLQDVSNRRTDGYGGDVERRSRFPLEVLRAIAHAIGEERTALRLSPWNTYQNMRMADPIPQYTHLVSQLKLAHPKLAYIHVAEPDANHSARREGEVPESNDFIRRIWAPKPLISAYGYTRQSALERTQKYDNELIAFGKPYLSNPDLPTRLVENIPLNAFDPKTFYIPAEHPDAHLGYIDYPFASEEASPQIQAQL